MSVHHRTRIRTRVWAGALVGALALLSACSDSDATDASDVTFAPDTSETTTSTTEATTTTTEATTTTVDPKIEAEELIRASAIQGREDWVVCTNEPADCDPETLFASNSTGSYYELSVQAIQSRQEEGRVSRHPDDIEDNDFLRVEEVVVADDLQTATLIVCERDGRASWIPAPDGELVMVEGTYGDEFTLAENRAVFEDGAWKIADTTVIAQSIFPDEEPVCDPE